MWSPYREIVCAILLFVVVSTGAHARGGPLHLFGVQIGFYPQPTVHCPPWSLPSITQPVTWRRNSRKPFIGVTSCLLERCIFMWMRNPASR
jgi:hypothetical protein